MVFENNERIFIAINYHNFKSPIKVKREFRKKFNRNPPSNETILRIHNNLMTKFRIDDLRSAKLSRKKTVFNKENIEKVEKVVKSKPNSSLRRIKLLLNKKKCKISKSSIQKILKKGHFHPYRMILRFELKNNDFNERVKFSHWMKTKFSENENFMCNLIFSDESTFCIDGSVNRWNMRY